MDKFAIDDNIFKKKMITTTVSIAPKFLNTLDFDSLIVRKLKEKIGKYSTVDGIVDINTIEIINRSLGKMINSNLSGSIHYTVKFSANVCMPYEGQIIQCNVDEHTDTQTICYIGDESSSPLEIYLNKQHYNNNAEYASLKKGDNIMVRIINYNIEAKRDKIDTIGEFLGKL